MAITIIVIYINIIGLERKHYSLFGSSPKLIWFFSLTVVNLSLFLEHQQFSKSGPGCSKLTTSLVNVLLKFQQ